MGDHKNIAIPYGSLPGESTDDRVRIPEEKWRVLRSTPDFKAYWNCERADDVCVYKLTVAAYIRGFTEREVRTMLSIWHDKHRKTIDPEEWVRYVRPNALKKAKEYAEKRGQASWAAYRESVQQIEANPCHPEYPKFWVACLLDGSQLSGDPAWSIKEICEFTRLSVEAVQNVLLLLEREGRIDRIEGEALKAVPSWYWDRLHMPISRTKGVPWNRIVADTWIKRMRCFDVRTGRYTEVFYDAGQTVLADAEELHWIVNHEGEVVRRDVGSILPRCFPECQHWQGVGYRNGRKTDCRLENLMEIKPGEVKVPLW